MKASFEIGPSTPEGQEPKMEVRTELLEAKKYFDYLVNALPGKTPKDVQKTPEYIQVLKDAKERSEELKQYVELMEKNG